MSFRISRLSWCGNLHRILDYLSSSIRRGRVSRPTPYRLRIQWDGEPVPYDTFTVGPTNSNLSCCCVKKIITIQKPCAAQKSEPHTVFLGLGLIYSLQYSTAVRAASFALLYTSRMLEARLSPPVSSETRASRKGVVSLPWMPFSLHSAMA